MAKTIEQKRAAHALEKIRDVKSGKNFISIANGLPTMIHTNGLGQAIAFCLGKSEKDPQYREIVAMLSDWLCSEGRPYSGSNPDEILTVITESDMRIYMLAQAEAMAYLLWVKKFAKALIGE